MSSLFWLISCDEVLLYKKYLSRLDIEIKESKSSSDYYLSQNQSVQFDNFSLYFLINTI